MNFLKINLNRSNHRVKCTRHSMLNFSQYHRLNIVCKKIHGTQLRSYKTSNRVLTVARSSGRITEDFLWLGVLWYISGHRAREIVDQGWPGCKIAWCSKHYTPHSSPPSLAALTKSFIGFIILSIDWLAATSFHSLGHQVSTHRKGFWMLRLHHSVFFIMFSYSSTTCCVLTFFSKQHKSRLKG